MVQVSGFTIVRNANRLHYPFLESVRSALPLCDEFIISCGDSQDDTRDLCAVLEKESPKVRVMETQWAREGQSGGFQLKHQTDLALQKCQGQWCLYLQADEALHELDYPAIRAAIEKASLRSDVDGLVFDWKHFYGSFEYEIRGRNWYRREVRLFKNHRGIQAFRDAQGFRRNGQRLQVLRANARVFHYGYVRTPASLEAKSSEMAQWWGSPPPTAGNPVQLHRHVGLRKFKESHPAVLAKRIALCPQFDPQQHSRKWDRNEIKNALTLIWESVFPYRIGEYRNYDIVP